MGIIEGKTKKNVRSVNTLIYPLVRLQGNISIMQFNYMLIFYTSVKRMFSGYTGISMSVRLRVRACVRLFTKYYFPSKCWRGIMSHSMTALVFFLNYFFRFLRKYQGIVNPSKNCSKACILFSIFSFNVTCFKCVVSLFAALKKQ